MTSVVIMSKIAIQCLTITSVQCNVTYCFSDGVSKYVVLKLFVFRLEEINGVNPAYMT